VAHIAFGIAAVLEESDVAEDDGHQSAGLQSQLAQSFAQDLDLERLVRADTLLSRL
jgi:hypothetical protein